MARHPSLDSGSQILNARTLLDQLEVLVTFLERSQGHSWADIADKLGVERQSLHRRLSRKVDEVGMSAEVGLRQDGYVTSLRRNLAGDLSVLEEVVADMLAASRPVRDRDEAS
jgi:hypothetical protein